VSGSPGDDSFREVKRQFRSEREHKRDLSMAILGFADYASFGDLEAADRAAVWAFELAQEEILRSR
jgi:hypothetical protein